MWPISLRLKCYSVYCIFGRNCFKFDLRQYQNHRIKSLFLISTLYQKMFWVKDKNISVQGILASTYICKISFELESISSFCFFDSDIASNQIWSKSLQKCRRTTVASWVEADMSHHILTSATITLFLHFLWLCQWNFWTLSKETFSKYKLMSPLPWFIVLNLGPTEQNVLGDTNSDILKR